MLKILALDPSGTGTTGIYYWDGKQGSFHQFTDKEWIEHFKWVLELVLKHRPTVLLYEHTNFISLRGKDMTSLLKLLGALEVLPTGFTELQTKTVPVNQVKELRNKLLKGKQKIAGLTYEKGKGWFYQEKKISVHQLDAFLVYYLWKEKDEELASSLPGRRKHA